MDGVAFIGQPRFIDADGRFAIKIAIGVEGLPTEEAPIPAQSEWFVLLDATYPLGSIDVYPSKENGVVETFHHQNLNMPGNGDCPWRTGKICLDNPASRLGLVASGADPIGDAEARLRWHLCRATAWVWAAAHGTLVHSGDPFELPFCPTVGKSRIVHDESLVSFSKWDGLNTGNWGIVEFEQVVGVDNTELAACFLSRDGAVVRACRRHEEQAGGTGTRRRGLWWLWPTPATLKPWRIPITWHDMRTAGKMAGVDVDGCLRQMARFIRGYDAEILLLGYPIPLRCDQDPAEVHWQAILLPRLEAGGKPPRGFRANERGWWYRDRNGAFGDGSSLEYMKTANWHPDRMQARGRLAQQLRDARVALLGCGALGSILAELLIRGGVGSLLLVDGEDLATENLVRHVLDGQDVGKNKAAALAERLASTAPLASVTPLAKRFPEIRSDIEQLLDDYDLVIDCTGSEEVPMALALGWWSLAKLFVSSSVGYEARRTFVFVHRGHTFPASEFRIALEPHVQQEQASWCERGETLEGAGCWSPVFPARLDDLLLAAGACIKVIEEAIRATSVDTGLVIFEQQWSDNFVGIRRVDAATAKQDRGD